VTSVVEKLRNLEARACRVQNRKLGENAVECFQILADVEQNIATHFEFAGEL